MNPDATIRTPQSDSLEDRLAYDRAHVWHPYSSALTPQDPYLVESAHGVRLRLRDRGGEPREVVDAMSSWWSAIHGYAVPELDEAARRQLGSMSHVMFGGLTHEPAVGLARRLLGLAPDGLEHVFLADSGSVSRRGRDEDGRAVHRGRAPTHEVLHGAGWLPRRHVLAHVVSTRSAACTRSSAGFCPSTSSRPDRPVVSTRTRDAEWRLGARDALAYAAHADEVAAVIVEPVLQGAGGMHT